MILAFLLSLLLATGQSSPGYASYERANALFVAQQFPECLEEIEKALQLDPGLVPALTLKAKLAIGLNRFDVARQALERALKAAPSSWYVHFLMGFQYHLQNELQLALPELEQARRLNPKDAKAPLYLGLTHESLGETEKAAACYREAIRIEEAAGKLQADTLLTWARFLLVTGRLEECEKLIERAVKLEPSHRDVHYERARLLLRKGDAAGAAREGEAALRLPATGITGRQIRYLLVRAYGLGGDEKRAAGHAVALREEESAVKE
ncbi:MAG: tetratricopeptide repeat protein [Acidobacteria bacterium]|nr:tetratricopeptide repeat protein [Acidobacteriota bacterium]